MGWYVPAFIVVTLAMGCRAPSPATPQTANTPPRAPKLESRYALDFHATNEGCRGVPIGVEGHAQLALTGDTGVLTLEILRDNSFFDVPIRSSSGPVDDPSPPPIRCRWRGQGTRGASTYTGTLELEGDDAHCGKTRSLTLECSTWAGTIADVQRVHAPASGVHCKLQTPYPEPLWALESGGTLTLGATGLSSELKLLGFGGTQQKLFRHQDPP